MNHAFLVRCVLKPVKCNNILFAMGMCHLPNCLDRREEADRQTQSPFECFYDGSGIRKTAAVDHCINAHWLGLVEARKMNLHNWCLKITG